MYTLPLSYLRVHMGPRDLLAGRALQVTLEQMGLMETEVLMENL